MTPSPLPRLLVVLFVLLTGPLLLGASSSSPAWSAPVPAVSAPARPAPLSGAVPRAGPFGWPLAAPHPVVRPFQAPDSPYGPGHRGIDLGGDVGEPVLAAADGVVVFAGQLVDRGVVSVDHADGLRTTYEPMAPAVTAGERVAAGAVLGHLRPGHAGCTGAPACLHWGVRRGGEYLDPLALVARAQVRLLPWEEATE